MKTLTPNNSLNFDGIKDKKFLDQLSAVYESFFQDPKTMKEADKATGIMRENICWYCRHLRLQKKLYAIGKRYCKITKHRATVYTTNPDLVPKSTQLSLF